MLPAFRRRRRETIKEYPLARKRERRRFPRRWNDPVFDLRRRFVYGIPALLLLFMGLLGGWTFVWEPSRLVVRTHAIRVKDWPQDLRPLRVACLGDIHGGSSFIDRTKLWDVVQLTNRQKADLVVLLGDYVVMGVLGGNFMEPEDVADGLRGLEAPLGVYVILGNHDWWYNGLRVAQSFKDVGYTVLQNEIVPLSIDGHTVNVVGLEDEWTRRPDVVKVLSLIPVGEPTIVLAHNPDTFARLPHVNGVTFAAHTHGGQVRFPFMGAPVVPSRYRQRYVAGHVEEGSEQMFVTSGIGTSLLPLRFGVLPEIAVITLSANTESSGRAQKNLFDKIHR
ncbi:MAG: metallophosphoesterase [Elusimicrobia bacterium]|nr:metallophosphoesterase [Elusimicrobiota bacterium]